MKKIILLLLVLVSQISFAQMEGENKQLEDNFAMEVKTIDEFLERFNDDKTTVLRTYTKEKTGKDLTRPDLLKSLFNYLQPAWKKEDASEFARQVCNPEKPVMLDFYGDEWYALCECIMKYKGVTKNATILLTVSTDQTSGAAKWIIRSANVPFLNLPKKGEPSKFLNPISHATDFIGLGKAFEDKDHIQDYTHPNYVEDGLSIFLNELNNGNLKFGQVYKITYHFLAVDNWIFTANHYNRPGKNSGWLISQLMKKSNFEKEQYKRNVLKLYR